MTTATDERIPATVLGATGVVGQRFVQWLSDHPWFRLEHLAASDGPDPDLGALSPRSGPGWPYRGGQCRAPRRPVGGVRFAILEGGVNHLMRPLLTGQPFPVRRVGSSDDEGALEPYTLAGPLCTSLDRLGEVRLPPLAAGDLLAFGMTGGCGFTEGMTHFLSHPPPPEVWIE